MKNNNESDFYEKFKICASTLKFEESNKIIKDDKDNKKGDEKMCNVRITSKAVTATCIGIILISGVVFATNFEKIKEYFDSRNIGKGLDSAIEKGYIENTNMDYIHEDGTLINSNKEIINNVGLDAKIENFLMDDNNISVEFNFKFDEMINEYINLDNIDKINLDDLIVRDDNNTILYSSTDKETFENYCNENNLNYDNYKIDNYFYNSGLNSFFSKHNKNTNEANLIYNIYSNNYPKSKQLNFSFKTITISQEDKEITLTGNWDIQIDVPEVMYNRSYESYKVTYCNNKNFEIYAANVSETGFEIGIIISNIEKVEFPEELKNIQKEIIASGKDKSKEWSNIISQSPYKEMYENYNIKKTPIIDSYVENANGEKFKCSLSPSRKYKKGWIDNNRYEYYETYDMTKYNSTDKMKVVLNYYGENVIIELAK